MHQTHRTIARARKLRRDMTDAEARLWRRLRDSRALGAKFRRHVPIGSFIVGFCCRELGLVVEVDGGQHAGRTTYDEARTRLITEQGYLVLRFWNDAVLTHTEVVIEEIVRHVLGRRSASKILPPGLPHPHPLPRCEDARERGSESGLLTSRRPAGGGNLKEQIRGAARRLGFPLCGFAQIEPLPHAEFVGRWIADGNAAEMAYIERGLAKRLDPRLILPAARSVITVGYRYIPPPLPPIDWREQLRGRIAAYAFGADYHLTVAAKLRELAACITELCDGAQVRPYVDTGAVLEREWAANGGLGWFGKNTNILHTQEGSYFFLGELFTDIPLEPDAPVTDHCGTCTRCLDLCPTGALKSDYVLDARLCISYLTIEHRGVIPTALRPQLGNWIFGCDVCQEVCPWNEKLLRRTGVADTQLLLPYLPELLHLDEDGFRARFQRSAIRRAKRDGFVRNVAVVLGNTNNPAAVPPLVETLRYDTAPLVRAHAAWALGAIGDGDARRALDAARRREQDAAVRREIAAALSN